MLKFDVSSNAGRQTYRTLLLIKNSLVFIGSPCRPICRHKPLLSRFWVVVLMLATWLFVRYR